MNALDTLNSPPPTKTSAPTSAQAESDGSQYNLGRWIVIAAVLIVGCLLAGLIPRWRHNQALQVDTKELAIPTVNIVRAAAGQKLSGMLLPAEVRPFVEAPIYARASGYVIKWYVDIGADVKEGQLLATIDTPELDQELAAAKAGLVQAEAALSLSKVTAVRWAELLKTSSVSEQENAEKAADLQLKQANVDAAKATVQQYADLKAFDRVAAPFAGTVTARNIDIGDLITPGKELFRLSDTHRLRVYAHVPQSATPGIVVGGGANIIIPEMPGRKFPAEVVRTAGTIDAASRTLLVELDVTNSNNEIVAGSYVQVTFQDSNPNPAIVLPANTLLFRAEGPQIGVVMPGGKVELHDVLLGRDLGPNIEILSGLTTNEDVIINPSDSLVTGVHVRVAETNPDAMVEK